MMNLAENFDIFAQNMDCGYMLEPTIQFLFNNKFSYFCGQHISEQIKKYNIYPCKPKIY